jgi:hypothetical protein
MHSNLQNNHLKSINVTKHNQKANSRIKILNLEKDIEKETEEKA